MNVFLLHVLLLSWLIGGGVVAAFHLTVQDAQQRFSAWNQAGAVATSELVYNVTSLGGEAPKLSHFAHVQAFPQYFASNNAANKACRKGQLIVNGEESTGARRLRVGDVLTIQEASPTATVTIKQCEARTRLLSILSNASLTHSPFRILYEDDVCAVVCKPAGVHTLAYKHTMRRNQLTLDQLLPLALTVPSSEIQDALTAPLPRHRLDRRVAGPVVVAKTKEAMVEISRMFEFPSEYRLEKEYRAIVVGQLVGNYQPGDSFVIDSPIDGRPSTTEVTVVQQTPCNRDGLLTDLMLKPKTGRRHQLRRHCAEVLGSHILGDDLYHCGEADVRRGVGLFLYCHRLTFQHPVDKEKVVTAEIDEPMRFSRHREKAQKGYDWTQSQKEGSLEQEPAK